MIVKYFIKLHEMLLLELIILELSISIIVSCYVPRVSLLLFFIYKFIVIRCILIVRVVKTWRERVVIIDLILGNEGLIWELLIHLLLLLIEIFLTLRFDQILIWYWTITKHLLLLAGWGIDISQELRIELLTYGIGKIQTIIVII